MGAGQGWSVKRETPSSIPAATWKLPEHWTLRLELAVLDKERPGLYDG